MFFRSLLALGSLFVSFSVHADFYTGNGNTGFGGTVGQGSLGVTNDNSNLYFTFTRGSGNLNDALVLYFDTQVGGFTSTTSFTDTGDGLRRAISGTDGGNRTTVNFSAGFDADYAIAFDNGFGGLWQLQANGSHSFIGSVGLSPTNTNSAANYTFSTSLASMGMSLNIPVEFVGSYISTTAFRSDEAFGAGVGGGNPGFNGSITFTSALTLTAVPEPSTAALILLAGPALWIRRRR